jgi:hypothetical protein
MALQDIANGYYTNSASLNYYENVMRDAISGYFDKAGLKISEMELVWRRFKKKVYQKVMLYYIDKVGQAEPHDAKDLDPYWVQWADKHPRGQFLRFLAGIVATKTIFTDKLQNDPDELMRFNDALNKAQKFIRAYYFRDPYSDETVTTERVAQIERLQDETIEVFNRMVRAEIIGKLKDSGRI